MNASTIWEVLREVDVPGFDVDVVSSGLVKRVRVSKDWTKIAVYVDFLSSDPGCPFCKFINHTLMKVVADRIKEALAKLGFREVYVIDLATNAEI